MELFAVWPHWELNSTLFRPSSDSTKVLPFNTNLGFSIPVFSPGWKVFSLIISMILWFSSYIFSSSLEVFHWLISLSDFPPQFPITRLGGFSPATWSFETHQLPYGASIFSLVSRFFSSVSLIEFGGFSLGSHSRFSFKIFIQGSIQGSHSRFSFKIPLISPFNKFHAQQSSRPKKEAIVITWPLE